MKLTKLTMNIQLTTPEGGLLHVVSVLLNPALKWVEMVKAAAPQTPRRTLLGRVNRQIEKSLSKDYNPHGYDWIWEIGSEYPLIGDSGEKEVILANFPSNGRTFPRPASMPIWIGSEPYREKTEKILGWAKRNNLKPCEPRVCFAIAEQKPELNMEIGEKCLSLVTLDGRIFEGMNRFPDVWFAGNGVTTNRVAGLSTDHLGWFEHNWFAFIKENKN